MTSSSSQSIGIFDSGFGGLTVMRAIRQLLPQENIVYFGDTARVPYGNKSADTILRLSLENCSFLLEQNIKMLVIACNTACSVGAVEYLKQSFDIPIIGTILPAVQDVVQRGKKRIAVLGTRTTISSGLFQQQILKHLPDAQVSATACPLFVPLVEEGYSTHPMAGAAVQEYLHPLRAKELDIAILGCTHYPLLQPLIQKQLGPHVLLIDPAIPCAEAIRSYLLFHHLQNTQTKSPHYQFYVSDDPEKFRLLGKIFLNHPIENVFNSST